MSDDNNRADRAIAGIVASLTSPARVTPPRNTPTRQTQTRPATTPAWLSSTLAEGHAGRALMHAQFGSAPQNRAATHTHLSLAARQLPTTRTGLFTGLAGIAVAARAAVCHPADYAALLNTIDSRIDNQVRLLCHMPRALKPADPQRSVKEFDVIDGLSGVGAYLLSRGPDDLAADVIAYLVCLALPTQTRALSLPGWWASRLADGPNSAADPGHCNIGMAHGIAGPLAFLSRAYITGVRLPGHEDAISTIARWLMKWRLPQPSGLLWPSYLTRDELSGVRGVPPDRFQHAWCYGSPGVSVSLHLAGLALDVREWRTAAMETLQSSLRAALAQPGADLSLCHGLSGLLMIACSTVWGPDDYLLTSVRHKIAERILDVLEHPTGHTRLANAEPPSSADPGLLTGNPGVALALMRHRRPWETSHLATALLIDYPGQAQGPSDKAQVTKIQDGSRVSTPAATAPGDLEPTTQCGDGHG